MNIAVPARLAAAGIIFALAVAVAAACGEPASPLGPPSEAAARGGATAAAPLELVTVPIAGRDLTFWPYINFTPEESPHDPVNLIFTGHADPRNVRAILMSLDGTRADPFAGFDCTWTDAIGGVQVSFGEPGGWTGSVVQLECGAYDPFRFHIRLFPVGDRTLANAHVEILIPGTQAHQVLNWEVAEQFLVYELARSGVLGAAPDSTGPINQAPTMGGIPPQIYNLLTPELRALAGGPQSNVSEPVGMPTDGQATVLHIAAAFPAAPGTVQTIVIGFGQFIPKPFCASPGEMVRVDGPLTVTQTVSVNGDGELTSEMLGHGDLVVRPIVAFTPAGPELGDPITARVREHNRTQMRDAGHHYVTGARHQLLIPGGGPTQQIQEQLRVGPRGLATFRSDERCGP
jgi:hypothetical protein